MDPADAYGLSREAPPAGWIAAAEGTPGLEEGSLSPEGPAAAVRPPRRCTAPVGGAPRSAPNRRWKASTVPTQSTCELPRSVCGFVAGH